MSTSPVNLHTEDGIRAVLNEPKQERNRYIIYRMLQALYARQTSDEQTEDFTKHVNGIGFNKFDAPFLSDVAQKSQRFKNLTEGQSAAVAKSLSKYVGQLLNIAQATQTSFNFTNGGNAQVSTPEVVSESQEETKSAAIPEAAPVQKTKRVKKMRVVKRRNLTTIQKRYQIKESQKLISESGDQYYFLISFPEADIAKYEEGLKAIPECAIWHRSPMEVKPVEVAEGQPTPEVPYKQIWRVRSTEETLRAVSAFSKKFKFDTVGDILMRAQLSTSEAKELLKMSYATSAPNQKLPPLPKGKQCCKCDHWDEGSAVKKCSNCKHKSCKKCKGLKPLKFQPAGLAYALHAKRTFIADEMGLGKTIQALLVMAYEMKVKRNQGKWLLFVPATVKINWYRECKKWLGNKTTVGVASNKHLLPLVVSENRKAPTLAEKKKALRVSKKWLSQHQVVIVNYDRIQKYADHLKQVNWTGFVLDESHYCKGNSRRTRSCKDLAAAIEPEYVLMLSGTPVLNNPKELIRQLQIMGRMDEFGGPVHFLNRYCSVINVDPSKLPALPKMDENGAMIMPSDTDLRDAMVRRMYENQTELNTQLRSNCYVRREKSDVLTSLPDKSRTTILLDIKNRKEYERIERDVVGFLMDRVSKDEKFLNKIKKLSKEEQIIKIKERRSEVEYKSARAQALVKIEMCKQAAAIGKLDGVVEWIENTIENGEKVVMFANHRNIIAELESRLPKRTVSLVGGMSDAAKQESVDKFQGDPKTKLFIGSLRAAGQSITLTKSSTPAFCELGWTPALHDQAEDRCHRIGQKNAVNAYYLIAKNTIEEKIARLIEKKRNIVDATSYGDPLAKSQVSGTILGDLISEMTGKKSLD